MEWIKDRIKDVRTTGGGVAVSLVPLYEGVQALIAGNVPEGVLKLIVGLGGLALGFLSKSK